MWHREPHHIISGKNMTRLSIILRSYSVQAPINVSNVDHALRDGRCTVEGRAAVGIQEVEEGCP